MSKYLFIALVVVLASYFRSKCNAVDMSWQSIDENRLLWICLMFIGAGAISLLRGGPGDSPEYSSGFDDPDNITPKQRIERAKQHEKNT